MAKRIWNLDLEKVCKITHMFMTNEPVNFELYKKVIFSNITNIKIDNVSNIKLKYEKYLQLYDIVKSEKLPAKKMKATELGFYGNNSICEQYYIDRGYDDAEIKEILKNKRSTFKLENIAKTFNVNLEEARIIQKTWTDKIQNTLKNNPNLKEINHKKGNVKRVEYYINKGYSLLESKKIIADSQKYAASFVDHTKKDISNTQIGYWLKKGLTEEEAKIVISNRQKIFSLEKCILKHGEENGLKIWELRQVKWQEKMKSKTPDEIYNINIKKFRNNNNHNFFSISSFKFFTEIEQLLKNDNILNSCLYGNEELFLKNENSILFYDFHVIGSKILIEYNGSYVHPNKKILTEDKWLKWCNPFTKETADECYIKDQNKINLAKKAGYKVIEIWDSEIKADPNIKEKIKNIIKNELDRNKK